MSISRGADDGGSRWSSRTESGQFRFVAILRLHLVRQCTIDALDPFEGNEAQPPWRIMPRLRAVQLYDLDRGALDWAGINRDGAETLAVSAEVKRASTKMPASGVDCIFAGSSTLVHSKCYCTSDRRWDKRAPTIIHGYRPGPCQALI